MKDKKIEKDIKELVEEMICYIDHEFDLMGRVVENPTVLDRYLIVSALKALRLVDAIKILCKREYTDESFPILRSLIEHSINMRWIMNKDTDERLKKYMSDLSKEEFGCYWSGSLLSRMEDIGFSRDYYDFCVKVAHSYTHVNCSSLSWGDVYDIAELKNKRFSGDAILQVVAQMLGHVIKALNVRFSKNFGIMKEMGCFFS